MLLCVYWFIPNYRSNNQRLATLAASDSALSLIEESGRDVNTLSNAELCALAQANRAVHRSVSDISLPPGEFCLFYSALLIVVGWFWFCATVLTV